MFHHHMEAEKGFEIESAFDSESRATTPSEINLDASCWHCDLDLWHNPFWGSKNIGGLITDFDNIII